MWTRAGWSGAAEKLLRMPRALAASLALLWCALIYWLGGRPGEELAAPSVPGFFLNLAHAPLFGLLALWVGLSLRRRAWSAPVVAWTLAAVLLGGFLDELHQRATPGRDFSVLDVATDLAGAGAVLWVVGYLAGSRPDGVGLVARSLAGGLGCVAAAACASWAPRLWPGNPWL